MTTRSASAANLAHLHDFEDGLSDESDVESMTSSRTSLLSTSAHHKVRGGGLKFHLMSDINYT